MGLILPFFFKKKKNTGFKGKVSNSFVIEGKTIQFMQICNSDAHGVKEENANYIYGN